MRPRSPEHQALGAALRALRQGRGMSQMDLALESGLDRTYVGGIERGERNPSYANLLLLSETVGVRLSEWVAAAERAEPGHRHSAG
jgi:transcriptional regulator with XRE-family HTH domain